MTTLMLTTQMLHVGLAPWPIVLLGLVALCVVVVAFPLFLRESRRNGLAAEAAAAATPPERTQP